MSYDVIKLCRKAKIGNAAQKSVLVTMADKAGPDGTGVWCSKGTMARETDLALSTVKKSINMLLNRGLIAKTGLRECRNGATVVYKIVLEAVLRLHPQTAKNEIVSLPVLAADWVPEDPPTGSSASQVVGSHQAPNHPIPPLEPPSPNQAFDAFFEKAWAGYPKDRRREKAVCCAEFYRAIRNGTSPDEIVHAVVQYAQITAKHSRCKISFSDNWFKERKWRPLLRKLRAESDARLAIVEDSLLRCRAWIESNDPMCARLSPFQIKALMDRRMVTIAELEAAGISVPEAIARRA